MTTDQAESIRDALDGFIKIGNVEALGAVMGFLSNNFVDWEASLKEGEGSVTGVRKGKTFKNSKYF